MKIMIMEDELTSRLLLHHILSEYGEIDQAVDGLEALNLYKKSVAEGWKYDLICLDIMVPEMDGQEVLKHIRAIEEQNNCDTLVKRTKVVMITALNDIDNFMSAFNEQCEGYILKPFNREKISETLRKLNLIY